jgi:hypothetical protein
MLVDNRVSGPSEGRRVPRLTLDAVWLAVSAAYPFVVLNFGSLSAEDGDLWWTLALGRAIWESRGLPAADPLAFTRTSDFFHMGQWLANVLFFGAYRLGGYELLVAFRAALIAAAFAILYVGCRQAGARPTVAGICTLVAFPIANVGLSLRPQLLALLPFVLFLEATRHPRTWARWIPLLVAAMVFWTNVHGSFVFGLVLIGLALGGRVLDLIFQGEGRHAMRDSDVRMLGASFIFSALAALIVNPRGPLVLAYVLEVLAVAPAQGEVGGLLTEWVPTRLDTPGGPSFFASVGALLVLLATSMILGRAPAAETRDAPNRARFPLATAELFRLACFGLFALRSVRGIVWWGLVLPAPLAALAERLLPRAREEPSAVRPRVNALLVSVIVVGAVLSLPWWRSAVPLLPTDARSVVEPSPIHGVADWLVANGGCERPFHYVGWGPYLNWRLGPGPRTFVDGRFEAYHPHVYQDYALIDRGEPGWDRTLHDYRIDCLVLSQTRQEGLVRVLEGSSAWRVVYRDGDALVYRPITRP